MPSTPKAFANGRQRRRRSRMVVNAEGVRKWSSTSKAFASLSLGLLQPWVSKYCQRQRRRCWPGAVGERFQRCEDLFLARHPGLFQPWVSKYCQRQRRRYWLGAVGERLQRCEVLFLARHPGLFQPWVRKHVSKGNAEGVG